MYFDGSSCDDGCGIGILIIFPRGAEFQFAFRLQEKRTNNQTEYEALCKGLELLLEIGMEAVLVRGDSQVAINQSTDEFNCSSDMLHPYLLRCRDLMAQFQWVQRSNNAKANSLAQMASSYIEEEADV